MSTRTGQQIGNYQLTRFLGQGGFAEVYLAEHVHLGTQAAIKLLQMQVTDEVVQQFTHEARLIAALKSPHIVQVLDFGIERATPFLVMDYAPNGSLRQASPRGTRLSLATLVSYGKQIAGALQYAHDRKVIHRDVKPENMLVGVHGEILLSDFGIALISQSSRYQGKQEVGGTAAYMAPEQLMGRAVPASDQYALGIVVYEWLTGAVPFTGSFTEICSQHVLAPPAPLRAQLPSLPSQVEAVVFQALAKEPGQRFRRIDEFAQALEQASQGIRFATPPAGDTSTFVNQDITSTYINIDSPGAQFPHSGQMPGAQSQPLQSAPTFQMGPQVASSQVGQSTWFAPLPEISRTNPQTGQPAPRRPGPPTAPASGMPGMEPQYPMSSGPTKGNKVYLTIIGVLIVIVVIVGSIALYRPTAGNTAAQSPSLSGANANDPTGSPTSTLSRTPTAIPTPAGKVIPENMTIPCTSTYLPSELGGLQCKDLGITVSLNSIVIVPGGTMNWNFTVTNISPQPITVNATTDRATIYLEDSAGTPTKLNGGTFLDDTNLSGNQSLPITAIFPLAPTPDAPYYLHMTLYVMHVSANRWDYSTYATQKFTF